MREQWVTPENIVKKIQQFRKQSTYKNIYNYNFANPQFLEKLINYFWGEDNTQKYASSVFEIKLRAFNNTLNGKVFENPKMTHMQYYLNYYLIRGWDLETAKILLRQAVGNQTEIFYSHDDILIYFKNINSYDINLNNTLYLEKLFQSISFKYGSLILRHLEKILNNFFCMQYPEIPKKSRGYITIQPYYWIARGYSQEETNKIISAIQKERSPLSVNYYNKRGISDKKAKDTISKIQAENASYSKSNKKYWLNLGFSELDASRYAKEYASKRSVWSKTYWTNLGYSEEEAVLKCLEHNGGSPLCKKYKGSIVAFYEHLTALSNAAKDRYLKNREELYNVKDDNNKKIKIITVGHGKISKSEKMCFETLHKINPQIKHKPYIVAFPPDFISLQNKVCYICDGYLEIMKNRYIIIEYDGAIGCYHDPEVDMIKSEEILVVDENVIGIIRIRETLFKNYALLAAAGGLNNIVKAAINNITTGKEQIIILE